MKYEVTAHYSETVEVEAENESEAISKAQQQLKNINVALVADNFEVEEIEN